MSILWIGWELFVNLMEEGMFCYLLTKSLGYKKEKVLKLYIGFFLLIIFTTILNISLSNTNTVIPLLLIGNIIFATVCFESNYSSRFFWGCTASIIGIVSNTIVFWLAATFTSYDLTTLLFPTPIRVQMTLIYLLVCSIFYFTLIQLKTKNKITLPIVFRIVLFLLLVSGLIASDKLIDFSISINKNSYIGYNAYNILGFIGGIYLFVLLGCVFLFEILGVYHQKNSELSMKLQEATLQQRHFENIQASMKTLREWKHDYHHHIQIMQALIENQQHSEIKDYLQQLNTNFTKFTNMVSTGNPTFDAILSSKILIAKTYDISVEYSIFLPEKLSIPQTDLCIVLGNLLDNAIESCNKPNLQQAPYINITIKKHKDMLYIKIINSSDGIYLYDKNNLISTKKQKNHGYGCKKINEIVENYGGFCNMEPENNSFATTIMIPLPNEEEEM